MTNGKERAGIAPLMAIIGKKPPAKQNGLHAATAISMDESSGHTKNLRALRKFYEQKIDCGNSIRRLLLINVVQNC